MLCQSQKKNSRLETIESMRLKQSLIMQYTKKVNNQY